MTENSTARSLQVQSVIYLNEPTDIVKAAVFTANSAQNALTQGAITEWCLRLGDCSPSPALSDSVLARIASSVSAAGGTFSYRHFGANLGSAAGHNALAADGDSSHLLIINPDALMAYDTVANLFGALHASVGIVEARQLPLEHPKSYEKYTGDTSWASTACALTTREAFDSVDGFDSDTFFLYCDDVDYSWRLRLAGYRVVFEPAARLFHDKRLTQTGDWPASAAEVYYSAEAALLLAHKYSRQDLVQKILASYRTDPNEAIARAVAEYHRRVDENSAPKPIDEHHKVAEFIDGNYAAHRY